MIVLKTWLPTLLTFGNLILGFLALMMLHTGFERIGLGLIILAMFLDGLDGRMARKLNVSGKIGKELDSLSDTLSFGVVPAYFLGITYLGMGIGYLIIPIIFISMACYRVAVYNYQFEEGSSDNIFFGLPLPVAGIIAAFFSTYQVVPIYVITVLILVMSGLMVTSIPYPSLKNYRPKDSMQIVGTLIMTLLLSIFHFLTAILFGLYIVLGVVNYLRNGTMVKK